MEVHHHAHEPHKKWTHYFWEFLMLFLAVSLGFLVENMREHYMDHQREIKYMKSMLHDLSRDTVAMNYHSFFDNRAVGYADSLVQLMNSPKRSQELNDIYYYTRMLTIYNPFFYSNATISQLKSSGLLRLIHESFVADSIVNYDIYAQRMLAVEENVSTVIQNFRTSMGLLINAESIREMIDTSKLVVSSTSTGLFVNRLTNALPLISEDPKDINQFCTYANFLLTLYRAQFTTIKSQKVRAVRLMELIKKEYHFD
jgi:hypothetical protein